MQKENFSITINAPKEKVWKVLWDDDTYRKWTGVFSEGSYAESDWKEGSKIKFLSPKGEGMYSVINKKIGNEFMSFKHLGVVKDGIEQPLDEETKKWSGAMEEYTLREENGITNLDVEMDITDEYKDYFKGTWPKALQKVKELVEE
ncbi:MAG: SRPBCC domain-containing protein [Fimbriimonadaceae bacterium]|nr:SRPBCC domain-containing protein [Chitinophagales bacterium]